MNETINRIKSVFSTSKVPMSDMQQNIGLPRSAITEWSKGKARPSIDAYKKIANAFNVSIDWLLFGDACESYVRFPLQNDEWIKTHCESISSIQKQSAVPCSTPHECDNYVNLFNSLSAGDQEKVMSYMDALANNTRPTPIKDSPNKKQLVFRI